MLIDYAESRGVRLIQVKKAAGVGVREGVGVGVGYSC